MAHLTFEDRVVIDTLIKKDYSLQEISEYLEKNTTTIYREIKNRRTLINDKAIANCPKTNTFPFVCFNCKKKNYCKLKRYSYHARNAELQYQTKLKQSRRGIDLTEDELEYLNNLMYKKIAHDNQSVYHFLKTYSDEIPVSQSTIYRYLNSGFFSSFGSEYMPRMLSFKVRNKNNEEEPVIKVDPKYRIRRKYKDYRRYLK